MALKQSVAEVTGEILTIPLDLLIQDDNKRSKIQAQSLAELMQSLKANGQLQPISVKEEDDGRYRVIFGNRRIEAIRKLGWTEVKASVSSAADKTAERVEHLVENIQRKNIPMVDEGRGYDELITKDKLNISEVSVRVGRTPSHIRSCIQVFHRVPEKYRDKIQNRNGKGLKKGIISPTMANILVSKFRKNESIDEGTKEAIWEYASKDDVNESQLRMVVRLAMQGVSAPDAIAMASEVRHVVVECYMHAKTIEKLERRFKKTIRQICLAYLSTNEEFKFINLKRSEDGKHLNQQELNT